MDYMLMLIQDLMDKRIEAIIMDAMPKYMLGNEEISDGRNAYYLSCKQTAEYLLDKYKIVPLEPNTSQIEQKKYISPYESVITYKCDKNFNVRLKAMVERAMHNAGYKTYGKRFDAIMNHFKNPEQYLFEKTINNEQEVQGSNK